MTAEKQVSVPDFDDMASLIEEIDKLSLAVGLLTLDIKNKEAEIIRVANTDSKYFIDGKRPSITYITSTFKQLGLGDELVDKRRQLIIMEAELTKKQNILNMYKYMIDVWRSQNANLRKGSW